MLTAINRVAFAPGVAFSNESEILNLHDFSNHIKCKNDNYFFNEFNTSKDTDISTSSVIKHCEIGKKATDDLYEVCFKYESAELFKDVVRPEIARDEQMSLRDIYYFMNSLTSEEIAALKEYSDTKIAELANQKTT